MDRVVRALGAGKTIVDGFGTAGLVEYLIFELADADVRHHLAMVGVFDLAWILRSLHHTATGLKQLHSAHIAHQDLKPSNVLVYEKRLSKIADLGCASYRGAPTRIDGFPIAGDPTYAPPEHFFNHLDPDWRRRRLGGDLYLLGSMAMFFFLGEGTTPLLFSRMQPAHLPNYWGGTYEEVLPFVRNSLGEILALLRVEIESRTDRYARFFNNPLLAAISQLCEPDLDLRGHPADRRANQFSLERYVSLFDCTASRAEYFLRRG
jgi:serine/threonine protein kinase